MNAFTIKDLENLTGIKAHTIRIWEQRYSFLKPQRTDTNIRYYNNEELKKILNIALLNKYGYKISHIDRMTEVEINDKILTLNNAQAQQERVINDLIQFMIDMDLHRFEAVLDDYIRVKGIEKCINHIIFPFMERIGVLWITGHINPAQEHLVSNIIRQKLIVGTEMVVSHIQVNKTGLLFLPEGEFHELGLLFINYLLKSRGVKVLYLGANVPIDDIEYVINIKKPDFLYTHLTSVSHGFNFERFMAQATRKFGNTTFIISGRLASAFEKKIPPKVNFKRSLQEVTEFISTI
ncbi:MAG: MerR family transcriptional regulator [Chitinophagaceae bacterium]|jgi:DNA-binding transcriptional MerR regulator|nr:MerR family transcriptional regulator [Chitinophagaceae bacterium]